ncbi:hypothetical protein CHARACLAT_029227 [Characodon lateralis]|uniref:Uncharacterized protein n=1 Tax=Characodon lateralis TaxID=208331 RepID=A0ABU7E4Q6_9TELE|nr:hypothetical protein [Characodon lateralis]
MPSRAPVSTAHHPQHSHGRPARVEVHGAGGELVRPGQGRAGQGRAAPTPPPPRQPPPPPLHTLCPYQTVRQRPRQPGDSISVKETSHKIKKVKKKRRRQLQPLVLRV